MAYQDSSQRITHPLLHLRVYHSVREKRVLGCQRIKLLLSLWESKWSTRLEGITYIIKERFDIFKMWIVIGTLDISIEFILYRFCIGFYVFSYEWETDDL